MRYKKVKVSPYVLDMLLSDIKDGGQCSECDIYGHNGDGEYYTSRKIYIEVDYEGKEHYMDKHPNACFGCERKAYLESDTYKFIKEQKRLQREKNKLERSKKVIEVEKPPVKTEEELRREEYVRERKAQYEHDTAVLRLLYGDAYVKNRKF